MHEAIELRYNTASATEIAAHLRGCDGSFVPPLSSRVAIDDYAQKLASHAERVELWADGLLIGLAAFYGNQPPDAFLSSISVLPTFQKRHLARQMLAECIARARGLNCASMTLEVSSQHEAALALYHAQGFTMTETVAGITSMALSL
jgi:ribosomal protein S18 acetylase RimI-like enzyme